MTEAKSREFSKRVIVLADGRRLIYYDFQPEEPQPLNAATNTAPVQGKEG